MSLQSIEAKYDRVCDLLEGEYPVLAPMWRQAKFKFGGAWLSDFVSNLELIVGSLDDKSALTPVFDGYAEFANDALRSHVFFKKHGHYKAKKHSECFSAFYDNEEHMTKIYLPGIYVSHYLWPQHYNMLLGFKNLVSRLPHDTKTFFEVGVGCGMYSKAILQWRPEMHGAGFDISKYSLNFTADLIGRTGASARYNTYQIDIANFDQKPCDFLICQEVLEHLENPEEFCTWLFRMLRPGGKAYITAALNAGHSDHIYLFKEPMDLEKMLVKSGFKPICSQEEFAWTGEARAITPSLCGYFLEK